MKALLAALIVVGALLIIFLTQHLPGHESFGSH